MHLSPDVLRRWGHCLSWPIFRGSHVGQLGDNEECAPTMGHCSHSGCRARRAQQMILAPTGALLCPLWIFPAFLWAGKMCWALRGTEGAGTWGKLCVRGLVLLGWSGGGPGGPLAGQVWALLESAVVPDYATTVTLQTPPHPQEVSTGARWWSGFCWFQGSQSDGREPPHLCLGWVRCKSSVKTQH